MEEKHEKTTLAFLNLLHRKGQGSNWRPVQMKRQRTTQAQTHTYATTTTYKHKHAQERLLQVWRRNHASGIIPVNVASFIHGYARSRNPQILAGERKVNLGCVAEECHPPAERAVRHDQPWGACHKAKSMELVSHHFLQKFAASTSRCTRHAMCHFGEDATLLL